MVIGYIKEEKLIGKFFRKIEVRSFNDNYIIAVDNKNDIKIKKKLIKAIKKLKIEAIVFSKSLEGEFEVRIRDILNSNDNNNIGIKIINGKKLMEYMQYEILEYIIKKRKEDIKLEDVYIVFKKDSKLDLNFLKKFIENFRMTNIVTNEVDRLKNVQDNLLENDNILISVSNNKRKALKRAKYILNVNLDKAELEKYRINRNSTIINIKENVRYDNVSFDGININNFNIELSDEYVERFEVLNEKFENTKLYESVLINENYTNKNIEKIYDRINNDEIKVKELIGNNGKISDEELKMNK